MSEYAITNSIRTLRFLRDEMTQKQLADAIGVTRQTVMAIEANKYSPTLEVAFKISLVFNLPLEEVFQYKTKDI
ncbi:helix-turn-helix transcriptional regulator [Pseudoalteromonas sp. SCSIO 43095]|jgi:putative transcriptional regulator|uniref:DNA-binding protein n=1 Tax=Pseudoalteromonas undina TaxID=43660 RepID=A0ABN0NG16_9GAMM|nr:MULTISPECIES: helix-turn-helix transcriptional regulator [Pseudoalteromonas]MBL0688072.1 helix-turn-helix transcriptional regulator [Pseudoalteromonas sp.]OLF71713.1 XRE family transcriptional regulator [Pseudoalteromonas haloplanktis]KAF7767340.1 putative transcriptional regulator [Pseudoalteromonas undina]KPH89381.1 XRE family transcriptional regulator [Pseudoalteromonas undina]MBT2152399.1 helix-turn-helix transcriptional regulator [Pseudoalteromonas tetraodonis]|tara:strand:+ start:237 stop:458 length:222 start_codon:yes stop_codon:yes gene_type:complete